MRFRHSLLRLSLFPNECVYDSVPNIRCPSFSSSALSKGRRNGIRNNVLLPAVSWSSFQGRQCRPNG